MMISKRGFDIRIAQRRFPVQETPCVFVVVELVEVRHAKLDLSGQTCKDPTLVLLLVWPVASGEYFDREFECELLIK